MQKLKTRSETLIGYVFIEPGRKFFKLIIFRYFYDLLKVDTKIDRKSVRSFLQNRSFAFILRAFQLTSPNHPFPQSIHTKLFEKLFKSNICFLRRVCKVVPFSARTFRTISRFFSIILDFHAIFLVEISQIVGALFTRLITAPVLRRCVFTALNN